MNSVKTQFASVTAALAPFKTQIQLFIYLVVAGLVIYTVYSFLFPPPDKLVQNVLSGTKDTTEISITNLKILPPITTGGEYTIATWLLIKNWLTRNGQVKHVFTIKGPAGANGGKPEQVTMICMLYPNQNKLMIRVAQDSESMGAAGRGQGPDMTLAANIKQLFAGKLNPAGTKQQFTMDYPICDVGDVDLQKWVNLAVVVNGRVIDVYVDGKLARSCVAPGIPIANGAQSLSMAAPAATFGGAMSTTRIYGYAITPAKAYELYQEGPAEKGGLDKRYGFIGWLGERMGLKVDFGGNNAPAKTN
jgi:hypothetical protein